MEIHLNNLKGGDLGPNELRGVEKNDLCIYAVYKMYRKILHINSYNGWYWTEEPHDIATQTGWK